MISFSTIDMSRPSSAGIIERLIGGCVKPWCAATALESGEMIMHQPAVTDYACGLRVSRAVHEDCRGSIAIIRGLATAAGADGPGRPSRRIRILAPVRGKRGVRAAVVELVARSRGGWVEVREEASRPAAALTACVPAVDGCRHGRLDHPASRAPSP